MCDTKSTVCVIYFLVNVSLSLMNCVQSSNGKFFWRCCDKDMYFKRVKEEIDKVKDLIIMCDVIGGDEYNNISSNSKVSTSGQEN